MKTLDPYQETGAAWLANGPPVLYLADQMRVGKTAQCVSASQRVGARCVVVICPAIARAGWLAEYTAFAPEYAERAVVCYSAADIEKWDDSTRLVVMSYELSLTTQVSSMLFARSMVYGLDVLILDEAHALTNVAAQRTARILGKRCTGKEAVAGLARRVWFVSGTPERTSPLDLFPFCRLAGLWKEPKREFINKFVYGIMDGYEFKPLGAKNLPALNRLIGKHFLRRLRSDLVDIPLTIGSRMIEARECYRGQLLLNDFIDNEPKYAKALNKAVATGDFDNIDLPNASSIRRVLGMVKVKGMVDIVRDALENDYDAKVAIFGLHRDPLKALRNELREYKPGLIFGGTSARVKDNAIRLFQEHRQHRVMICNMVAASTAIDLSRADTVYVFEPSWVPTDNAQALSRIIKLREPDRAKDAVFVGLANSIDDAVTRVCARRTADIEASFREV